MAARRHGEPDSPRKQGYVPCTYLWIAQGDTLLGSLAIGHELNDHLFNEGEHNGYGVRPSARRQGQATAALALALPMAGALVISRVLVTCLEGNAGSRGTMEKNRGVYEDTRNGTRRYWIDAGQVRAPERPIAVSLSRRGAPATCGACVPRLLR